MTLPLKFKSTISLFRLGKYEQNATSISAMNMGLLPKFKTRLLVGAKLASPCLFEPSERAEQALPLQKRKYSEMRLFGQQAHISQTPLPAAKY
jgi:hypothetical protein